MLLANNYDFKTLNMIFYEGRNATYCLSLQPATNHRIVGNEHVVFIVSYQLCRTEPRHKNPHCQDIAAMSETQRKFRLQINNTRNPARKQALKQQRNRILHAQRRRARDNVSVRLDHLASEVEHLHDGAKMFRAVREMTS